jgi:hypothetical protein
VFTKEFLTRLTAVWASYPHLRFGQLLDNILTVEGKDLFYVDDEELIEMAEKWARNEGRPA